MVMCTLIPDLSLRCKSLALLAPLLLMSWLWGVCKEICGTLFTTERED